MSVSATKPARTPASSLGESRSASSASTDWLEIPAQDERVDNGPPPS